MRNKLLTLILIFLLLIVAVPSTWSYFFTYTKATGTIGVDLYDDTDINECVAGVVKEVTITAKRNSDPVFVRVKVFKAPDVAVSYEDENWSLENDEYYYFYKPIDGVEGDPFADKAVINYTVSIAGSDHAEDETRHVVIVYEATPALFTTTQPSSGIYWTEKDGDTVVGYWYADWNKVLTDPTVEEGD